MTSKLAMRIVELKLAGQTPEQINRKLVGEGYGTVEIDRAIDEAERRTISWKP